MKLIIISHDVYLRGEEQALNRLFAEGMSRLHLRKPAFSEAETRAFLDKIEPQYRCRIVLHDYYALAREMQLAGVHFNQRNRHLFADYQDIAVSLSAHTVEDLQNVPLCIHYTFLSPIFDSISKEGYKQAFTPEVLQQLRHDGLLHKGTIALGGITPERIPQVADMGFGGVALLGSFWKEWIKTGDIYALLDTYRQLRQICLPYKKRLIAPLHYISAPHIDEVEPFVQASNEMLQAGVPLIQIRNKQMTPSQIAQVASAVRTTTNQLTRTLIINDNPYITLKVGADGVHLGKKDMSPTQARQLLGDNFIIGGTANTFDDVKALCRAGVDYIGLGPFRFTTTKDNLSPILGLDGYRSIIEQCTTHRLTTPIVAIGGITEADIAEVMQTGVGGIAMSGGLHADNFSQCQQRINNILTTIYHYE